MRQNFCTWDRMEGAGSCFCDLEWPQGHCSSQTEKHTVQETTPGLTHSLSGMSAHLRMRLREYWWPLRKFPSDWGMLDARGLGAHMHSIPPAPQTVTGNNVLKNNIVPDPVSLSHCMQRVSTHRGRTQNMQAHELLVGHMRLHNFQGLRLSIVVGLGVFKNKPPGLILGLFPDTVGSKFQRLWMHSSAHSDPKEVHFIIM